MIKQTTEFSLHSSIVHGNLKNMIDFTERKLSKMIDRAETTEITATLVMIYDEYRAGKLAVAWHHGTPVTIPIKKEKS